MSGRPVPIGTLDTPPVEVARAALARMAYGRRVPAYLVLRDGEWLIGRESAKFVGDADCGIGRIVARVSHSMAVDEIARIVEAARA